MVHPKVALTLAAIVAFPAFVIFTKDDFMNSKSGAVLRVESKAEGFFDSTGGGIWTLGKFNEPDSVQIKTGEVATINYTITATQNPGTGTGQKGATGEVCIKNIGKQATEGQKITNQVQYRHRGFFKNVDGATQTQTTESVAPGANSCTPFRIAFTPPENVKFRIRTTVSVVNLRGKKERTQTSKDTDGFSLPASAGGSAAEVTITDTLECPEGYTCTPNDQGPWKTTNSSEIKYSVAVQNNTADCTIPVSLGNVATLDDGTTKVTSGESVGLNSPPCT